MNRLLKIFRSCRGTLLLEVLLAVVILSVSLTAIIQSLLASLRGMTASADYSTAMILLDNKMFELMQKKFIRIPFTDAGIFPAPFEKYQYDIKARNRTDERNSASGINEVEVRVSWPSGLNQKAISATTFLLNSHTKTQQTSDAGP